MRAADAIGLGSYCGAALLLPIATEAAGKPSPVDSAPYEASAIIGGWRLDWSTHQRHAPGSDNWPITWAGDDHQYTAWGDGGGFGGSNSDRRVSLGVARIEGTWDNYR